MSSIRNYQTLCTLRWGAVSGLLILSLLLPAAQPVARSQGCEGQDCLQTPARAAEDLARLVSYAQVESSLTENGEVRFGWSTGYEVGIAGFNIVIEAEDGIEAINEELVPSEVIDSLEPQHYSYTATLTGDEFYLEHITIEGESHRSGPFTVGESVGEVVEPEEVDWAAIRAASEELAEEREAKRIVEINEALDVVRGPAPSPDEALVEQSAGVLGGSNSLYLPMIGARGDDLEAAGADAIDVLAGVAVNLLVKTDGLYRVTYEDIYDGGAGPDLLGVPSAYLALTNKGVPVRIRMVAAQNWGPGAYFEFVGEGIDTLYTDENVYVLRVDRSKAFRTYRNMREPDLSETAPNYYIESIRFEENVGYSMSAVEDPWHWGYYYATPAIPKSNSYTVNGIDQVAIESPLASVTVEVWGYSTGDHHITIDLNGTAVQDLQFTGAISFTQTTQVQASTLNNGANNLIWTLPGISTEAYDAVGFEAFEVEYPRYFMAQKGTLSFSDSASLFEVDGFPSSNVVIYSRYRNRLWRMEVYESVATPNGYKVTFPGWGADAQYIAAAYDQFDTPSINVGLLEEDITSGQYDYIIVAHSDFLSHLQSLIDDRENDYDIKVVNVEQIYAQYSHSVFDANAIHDYLKYAIEQMGAQYVLLVGADVRDYRGYMSSSPVSFVPSLYETTYPTLHFAPTDPLYTDVDGDLIPDAAIGRFPVRTTQELDDAILKTLAYSSHGQTAIFAADKNDGPSYSNYSDGFAAKLPTTWHSEKAYLDNLTVAAANQELDDAINPGVGLVSYLGHSNPDRWTFSGLYSVSDINQLTNAGKPSIFIQYGCWSSYYVNPTKQSMSETLLVAGDKGGAASFGATGLTSVSSDVALGNEFSERIAMPGMTIGTAMYEAKQAMANSTSADVVLGWVLFGDPTIKLDP